METDKIVPVPDYDHRAHVRAVATLGAACIEFANAEAKLAQIYSRGKSHGAESKAHDVACRGYDRALVSLAKAHAGVARYVDIVDGVNGLDVEDSGEGVPGRRPS